MLRLDGKHAVITGASSGIGAAIATLFEAQGATVTILDLNPPASGNFAACDVSDPDSVGRAFAEADQHGPIDLLVCSAGVSHVGNLLTTTATDFDRLMAINARGVFLCCQQAVRRMKASGKGGAIVNLCSIAAKTSLADRFGYAASKGAVLSITRSIAQDFITDKIRCNCVCPARVHTALVDAYLDKNYPETKAEKFAELSAAQPIGRMGRPDEIAPLVLYLCSDEAGFVTGAAYDIDGGVLAMH